MFSSSFINVLKVVSHLFVALATCSKQDLHAISDHAVLFDW